MLPPLTQIAPDLWIGPQLQAEDFTALQAQGFRTIINARPDHEAPDQPGHAELEQAAKHAGLNYEFLPVVAGQFTDAQIAAFDQYLRQLPGPVLAFCRSGNRCGLLWSAVLARRAAQA